jgi:hypothetical protein
MLVKTARFPSASRINVGTRCTLLRRLSEGTVARNFATVGGTLALIHARASIASSHAASLSLTVRPGVNVSGK